MCYRSTVKAKRQGSLKVNHVQRRVRTGIGRASGLALLALVCFGASAQSTPEIDDAAARIQYAFYTDDVRALQEVQDILARLEVPPQAAAMKAYYQGFSGWKAAQLYEARARSTSATEARASAIEAAQGCSKDMQTAISHDARFAEAHAIEALCSGLPQSLRASNPRGAQNACGKSKGLQTALKLEPNNPRVLLVDYLCQSDDRTMSRFEKLERVVKAFQSAQPSPPGRPDWGEAEALALIGEEYLRMGNAVAARNALERALVLAPDYLAAQKMLQTAASGR